jgi:hypothetical protein
MELKNCGPAAGRGNVYKGFTAFYKLFKIALLAV